MTQTTTPLLLLLCLCLTSFRGIESFASVGHSTTTRQHQTTTTELSFGIPTFGKDDNDGDGDDKSKIKPQGLLQLIAAGMGAPFLGGYEGVDKETGNFMFSLEANNLVDEKGDSKQTSMPYFESGWVDPKDLEESKSKGGFKLPWQK